MMSLRDDIHHIEESDVHEIAKRLRGSSPARAERILRKVVIAPCLPYLSVIRSIVTTDHGNGRRVLGVHYRSLFGSGYCEINVHPPVLSALQKVLREHQIKDSILTPLTNLPGEG